MAIDIRSSYLSPIFNPDSFKLTVESTLSMAQQIQKEVGFDTIVFSGTSGTSMGFLLSHLLNVPMLCVRKANDSSHYTTWRGPLEGNVGLQRYLIVDDFISSGETVKYIVDRIEAESTQTKCVGMLMYTQYDNLPPKEYKHSSWRRPVKVYTCRPSGV